jgi:mitogen-activated protein kinase organizer 1
VCVFIVFIHCTHFDCTFTGQIGRINVVESANCGQAFLTGSYDGSVYLWDARALNNHKPVQILHEAKDSIMDILLEPQHIVRTGSVDGVLRSYDFRKGFLTNDRMGAPIASMACTKNGEPCLAVSCLEDSTVRLMDVASGELVNTYSGNHVASQYKIDVDVLADDSCVGK